MRRTLVLGGTAWLGGEVARQAIDRGDEVVCLARGEAGSVPDGARLVNADREAPEAYDQIADSDWDVVVDVSRQPGQVRSAVDALGKRARHWVYVSSCSVYADQSTPDADESAALLPEHPGDRATPEEYGEGKSACEAICRARLGERVTLARSGLIGGMGDPSDRFGYWPGRFAHAGDGPVLVPDSADLPTECIDVRDVAAWLLLAGDERLRGPYNVIGRRHRLGDVLGQAREVAGHTGEVVAADSDWLIGQGVEQFMGPRSLPLWIPDPEWAGFAARNAERAVADGLRRRSLPELLNASLDHERALGLARERRAGLGIDEERELLAAWSGRP